MKKHLLLLGALVIGGCSFVLDFDDETDLPCPCLPDHVCLVTSNRCVKKASVEDYKSCNPDAENPNDLCQQGSICYNFRDEGPRCLPTCSPSQFSTPEAGDRLRSECLRVGTTCWAIGEGAGVCAEGECQPLPDTCGAQRRCVQFNAAGVCFLQCNIFTRDTCIGETSACHPIGSESVTACINAGNRELGQECSDVDPCRKFDQAGRNLVCSRPQGSTDRRRCYAVCPFNAMSGCGAGETCRFERNDIDTNRPGEDLGLCVPL